jgi:hypothetical protein
MIGERLLFTLFVGSVLNFQMLGTQSCDQPLIVGYLPDYSIDADDFKALISNPPLPFRQ